MLKSYRLYCAALGGCLALLLAGEGYAQSSSYPVGNEPENKATTTDGYTEPNCERPKSAEDANFCIQRRAAEAGEQQARWGREQAIWAHEQANWNQAQFWLGFVGLGAIVITLVFSVKATYATRDAAAAARDQVILSRQEFHLLHRPKIRVRNVHFHPPNEGKAVVVAAEFANVGDRVAILVFIFYEIESSVGQKWSGTFPPIGEGMASRLEPGSGITVGVPTDLIWSDTSYPPLLTVRGQVSYRDVFSGEMHDIEGRINFQSIDRRTVFERPYAGRSNNNEMFFRRAKEFDPEREYED